MGVAETETLTSVHVAYGSGARAKSGHREGRMLNEIRKKYLVADDPCDVAMAIVWETLDRVSQRGRVAKRPRAAQSTAVICAIAESA